MNLFTRSFLFISLLLYGATFLSAQQESGKIKGTVTDATTGDVMIGANVVIKGTSLGCPSDIDGKYIINAVPAGTYILKVSYIGYRSKETTVEVKGGSTLEMNFSLTSQALEGEEVVVTAQARGQKEAINQQLSSNTISNIVSAERIHELPDASAAAALSRLPGVSLMNGDQVVIRGVEAKLNQILLNGIELPSTDMDNRSTNLGFLSSNLLSGIEVIKALTPDMDANTIGGVVNLRLREAPTGLHFDVLSQGIYNSSDHVADNYKFWASISQRFFDDKLGVFIQGNMDRSDGGNQKAEIRPTIDGSGSLAYGQATYHANEAWFEYDADVVKTSGGSLIMDYQLPNGKIVLQNTYAGNVTDQNHNRVQLSFDNTTAIYTVERKLFGKDLWINALQAENTFGDIKIEASLSHSYTQQYTKFGHDFDPWTNFHDQTSTVVAPFGIGADGKPITYNSATAERNMTLNNALGVFNNLNPADADSATIGGWVSDIARQFRQHLYNGSFDVTAPVNFSNDFTAKFKMGGKYIRTTRENNVDENFAHGPGDLYANPASNNYFPGVTLTSNNQLKLTQVMNTNFTRGKYYLNGFYNFTKGGFKYVIDPNKYDSWLKVDEQGWAVPEKKDDSWKNDWNGAEQFSAGYLMGTFNIGPKLTLLGGARYESYNMNYHANFTFVIHSVYGDAICTNGNKISDSSPSDTSVNHTVPWNSHNVNRTDVNLFPDVQLQYKFNDWFDARLAYTTGISRPDYIAIIPKLIVYPGDNYEAGNPYLGPAKVQNGDVVATFHDNSLGLFTIDAFYKEITNQMYSTKVYYGNLSKYSNDVFVPDSAFLMDRFSYVTRAQDIVNISLNNPNTGFIRGVEIDWQTNFWYLPKPLNALVLDVNYTKSGSNTAYRIIQNNPVLIKDPITGRNKTTYQTVDTTYEGRLLHQANDVVNVALGIDYKGFSGRISFSMTGNVVNSVGLRPEESEFTGNIYRWDFTLRQNLPIEGLSVGLDGVNIFHNEISTYRNYRMNPDAPITKNLISVLYPITQFEANIRYSF